MPDTLPPPVANHQDLIVGIPEFPLTPNGNSPEGSSNFENGRNLERNLNFLERVRLGGDELAICGVIDLNPGKADIGQKRDANTERVIILDVGFRITSDGRYGPYDIDGSGEKRTFEKPYVLMIMKDAQGENGEGTSDSDVAVTKYIEVGDNQEVTLGRDTTHGHALGLGTNDHISRNHVSVAFGMNGYIGIKDNNSTNGTAIYAPGELVKQSEVEYGYTVLVSDFVHSAGRGGDYVPSDKQSGRGYGEYAGRPIIARDTEINGGVYPVGGTHGEAIVIDDKKYPEELNKVFETVLKKIHTQGSAKLSISGLRKIISNKEGQPIDNRAMRVLESVFETVSSTLRYDLKATAALASDSQKVSLSYYINEGVGVCRTQAVLSAYIIERMIKEGALDGRVSIDRSSKHNPDGDGSGHAWARFTDKTGKVYIIDPAQKYVGPIDKSPDRNWDYRRTEDVIKQLRVA